MFTIDDARVAIENDDVEKLAKIENDFCARGLSVLTSEFAHPQNGMDSCLHVAARRGYKCLRWLIDRGADPRRHYLGRLSIHLAANCCNVEGMSILLCYDSSFANAKTIAQEGSIWPIGSPPLFCLLWSSGNPFRDRSRELSAELLYRYGANDDFFDKNNEDETIILKLICSVGRRVTKRRRLVLSWILLSRRSSVKSIIGKDMVTLIAQATWDHTCLPPSSTCFVK